MFRSTPVGAVSRNGGSGPGNGMEQVASPLNVKWGKLARDDTADGRPTLSIG